MITYLVYIGTRSIVNRNFFFVNIRLSPLRGGGGNGVRAQPLNMFFYLFIFFSLKIVEKSFVHNLEPDFTFILD